MKKIVVRDSYQQDDDYYDAILCMSNVRGIRVHNPHKLPFSFYFSARTGVDHAIRVKPMFNPERLRVDQTGSLKLCDDWEYIPGENDKNISQKDIRNMKAFFRKYIVLFCAVWDIQLDDGTLYDYFMGTISLHDLITELDFYTDYKDQLDEIITVEELEEFCRNNNLVNLYGN